jgi:SAM-dependent methyltransferase
MDFPTGEIAADDVFASGLPREYLQFLEEHDPISRWEDIKPLQEPINVSVGRSFDEQILQELAPFSPQLRPLIAVADRVNAIAPLIGLRHAWSRCLQHGQILQAIEDSIQVRPLSPELVIDVGCSTGGLLHFLAKYWSRMPCVGFDLGGVALDVAHHLQRQMRLQNQIHWLEGSFAYLQPAYLPDSLGHHVRDGVVILCNVIEFLGRELSLSPAIYPWSAKAGLIAYWVQQGAAVYVCERHNDPGSLCETIAAHAAWNPGATMAVLKEFEAVLTENPTPENPIGDWVRQPACVLGFFPPGWYPAGRPQAVQWIGD